MEAAELVKKTQEELIIEYMKTCSDKEKQALHIASTHLQTSFQIEKSNGFIEFCKKQHNN